MTITTYERIIPPDVVSELISIGQSVSEHAFRVGDIANECVNLNKMAGNDITQHIVYQAIGAFCGKAGRTVRYYAEVAEKFPLEIRKKYESLSFSHFAFAVKYEHWQEILEYAVANFDIRNRPASVDHLVAVFGFPEKEITTNSNILDLVNNLRKEVYKIPMSGDMRRLIMDALQRIIEAVQMTEVS